MKKGDKVKFQVAYTDYQDGCLENDVESNGCSCPVKHKDIEGILIDFDMGGNPIVKFLNEAEQKTEIRVFELNQISKNEPEKN